MEQDTSPEARRRYIELLRSKTEAERFEAAAALSAAAREMTRVGIRLRHPEATEEELTRRFVEIVYGPDVAERFAGEDG